MSPISWSHNAHPLFLVRGSENLCEGRCFKSLIVQVTHHLFILCLEACAISYWSEQLQQLISALSFIIRPPLPCPASRRGVGGRKRKTEKEKHTCVLEDQRDLIWSHSWGCYGDGQFWSLGSRGCGAEVLRKALSCRVMTRWVSRARQSGSPFEEMTGLFSPLSTLLQRLSDGKPVSPPQIKHYLALLSMLWDSGRVLLPLCSNGPYNDVLKKWMICLWGFWIQLIWRGAQFLLW